MSTDIRRLLHKSYGDELSITMNGSDIKYVQVAQFATNRFGMNVHINLKHRDQRPILNAQFSVKDNQKKFEVVGIYNNPLVLEDKDNGKVEIAVIGNGVYLKLDNDNINNKISLDAIMEVKRDITYGILINENVIIYDGQVNPDVFHASTINLAADIEKNTDTLNVHTIYNKKKDSQGKLYTDLIDVTDIINTKILNTSDQINTKDLNWSDTMDGKKITAEEIIVSKTTSEGSLNTGTLDVIGNTTVSETMNATTVDSLNINVSNKLNSTNDTTTKDLEVNNKLSVNNNTVVTGNASFNNITIGQANEDRLVVTPEDPVKLDTLLMSGSTIKSIAMSGGRRLLTLGEQEDTTGNIPKHTTRIYGDLIVEGELTYSDDNRTALVSVDVKGTDAKSGLFVGEYKGIDNVTDSGNEHYFYIRRHFVNGVAQPPVMVSNIDTTFNDKVTLNESLIINNNTTMNSHLNINDGILSLKNRNIIEFEISYDEVLKDTRTFARRLVVDNSVGISSGGLIVTGDTLLKDKLTVDGETVINNELKVNNDVDITGNLHIDGSLTIGGSINVLTKDELHIRDKTIVINKPNKDSDSLDDGHDAGLVVRNNGDNVDISFKYNKPESGVSGRFNSSVPLNTSQYLLDKTAVIEKKDNVIGLGTNVLTSKLTSVGTINSGVWNGTSVGAKYGGTGQTGYAKGDILYSNSKDNLTRLPIGGAGRFLQSVGGVPEWNDITARNGIEFIDNKIGHTNLVTGGATTKGSTSTNGNINLYNQSFEFPIITYDKHGHLTEVITRTVTLPTPGNGKITFNGTNGITTSGSFNLDNSGPTEIGIGINRGDLTVNENQFSAISGSNKLVGSDNINISLVSQPTISGGFKSGISGKQTINIYNDALSSSAERVINIGTGTVGSSIINIGTTNKGVVNVKSNLTAPMVIASSGLESNGYIYSDGDIYIDGNGEFYNDLSVDGDVTINKGINVSGDIKTSSDFDGGHITLSGNVIFNSDKRLKNINKEIPSTLDGLMKTKLYDYNYTYSNERNIGVLAQDIEENFKEFDTTLVDTIKGDYFDDQKQLKETKLVYILWKALQEEVEERKKLEKRISELEKK